MNDGGFLLIDEISLADDAVLERLNSVLEPERKLLVSERTTVGDAFEIVAVKGFQLVATMNPGGDYGKKEVSIILIGAIYMCQSTYSRRSVHFCIACNVVSTSILYVCNSCYRL